MPKESLPYGLFYILFRAFVRMQNNSKLKQQKVWLMFLKARENDFQQPVTETFLVRETREAAKLGVYQSHCTIIPVRMASVEQESSDGVNTFLKFDLRYLFYPNDLDVPSSWI